MFQANQIVEAFNEIVLLPASITQSLYADLAIGLIITFFTALVIFGGITRIGVWASRLVPAMVVLYILGVLVILISNAASVIPSLSLIVTDAFTAESAMGGAVGALIIAGARRAAFSNEASSSFCITGFSLINIFQKFPPTAYSRN